MLINDINTDKILKPQPRVLVVDDDIGTIRLMISILEGMGEIFFATEGAEALSMMRERRPDLVLLDAEMPGMDGFELCAAIKSDPSFTDIPIIFVTAHTDVEIETKALDLGAVDFINKPPSPPVVRARVRTHLELMRRADELHRLASVDGLTGIANRRAFDIALVNEWRRASRSTAPLSLLMMDVDFFKRFNDHYGHQAGDDCLRSVAAELASSLHRPGEVVARYGGEEFAVILPSCDQGSAMAMAEKLRHSISSLQIPHAGSQVSSEVTVSIGVADLVFDADSSGSRQGTSSAHLDASMEGAKRMIAAADKALYEAKRGGRNRVCGAHSD